MTVKTRTLNIADFFLPLCPNAVSTIWATGLNALPLLHSPELVQTVLNTPTPRHCVSVYIKGLFITSQFSMHIEKQVPNHGVDRSQFPQ